MKVMVARPDNVTTYSNVKELTKTFFNDIVIRIQSPSGKMQEILIESTEKTFITVLDIN